MQIRIWFRNEHGSGLIWSIHSRPAAFLQTGQSAIRIRQPRVEMLTLTTSGSLLLQLKLKICIIFRISPSNFRSLIRRSCGRRMGTSSSLRPSLAGSPGRDRKLEPSSGSGQEIWIKKQNLIAQLFLKLTNFRHYKTWRNSNLSGGFFF